MRRTQRGPRARRTKPRGKKTARKQAEMGAANSKSEGLVDAPRQDDILSRLPDEEMNFPFEEVDDPFKEPDVIPEEPHLIRKCPACTSPLTAVLDEAGRPAPLLQCPQCPGARPLCEHLCLQPCPVGDGACANQSCQLVSMLLTCERVTEPGSRVRGYPLFRACPNCHSLMMHSQGCKYVMCAHCKHSYCFICLRNSSECRKDLSLYWSLSCSQPRAARQTFYT